jgi:hypothetical protein
MTAVAAGTCSPPASATLTQRGSEFSFAPNDGAIVITGVIEKDNSLHGNLALVGADHKPFTLTLDGTFTSDGFDGIYASPRCRSDVRLHPA